MRLKEEMRREKEAARLKAANNRAAARRMAKESMELVEDERLELMELAALSRGLPSILALDSETLQNLDLLKGIKNLRSTFLDVILHRILTHLLVMVLGKHKRFLCYLLIYIVHIDFYNFENFIQSP